MRKMFGTAMVGLSLLGFFSGTALAGKAGAEAAGDQDRTRQQARAQDCDQDCQGTPIQQRDRDQSCWDDEVEEEMALWLWLWGLE